MSRADHWDVAAYALGVLDPRDAERFEEHLAGCWACAAELESMVPVVDLLGEVDVDALPAPGPAPANDALLDRMLVTVGRTQRRSRQRQLLTLAAGIVLLAMLTAGALFTGTHLAERPSTAVPDPAAATSGPSPGDPWFNGQAGPGFGGPDVTGGEKVTATDENTGVRADLILASKPFGTQVSFALSRLPGPRVCRLVVLRKSGAAEVVSTWAVPVSGYGTASQTSPLILQASTAAPREDIDRVQVQSVDQKGIATPLVTVPL